MKIRIASLTVLMFGAALAGGVAASFTAPALAGLNVWNQNVCLHSQTGTGIDARLVLHKGSAWSQCYGSGGGVDGVDGGVDVDQWRDLVAASDDQANFDTVATALYGTCYSGMTTAQKAEMRAIVDEWW